MIKVDDFVMKKKLEMLKNKVPKNRASFPSFLKRLTTFFSLSVVVLVLYSCPGSFSNKPPIHPNPNMDFQPKKKAQSFSTPLQTPEGIVAYGSKSDPRLGDRRDFLKDHLPIYYGLVDNQANVTPDFLENVKKVVVEGNGALPNGARFIQTIPSEIIVDRPLIIKGFRSFQVYCAVCHGGLGVGDGLVVERRVGMPQPPDLSSAPILALSDGEIFNVISHGRRNMPGYAKQIKVGDRWAIVSYVRTLQAARNKKLSDLPQEIREGFLQWDKQRKEALKQQEEEKTNQ